jgi:hypothetical protein
MRHNKDPVNSWLQNNIIRVAGVHFLFVAAYMASIIVFDSWNLITHQAVSNFWTAGIALLITTTVIWYVGRINFSSQNIYLFLTLGLIIADITFVSYVVYWERGLASNAVALYALPLITAASLRSRNTLLATALISVGAYSASVIRYFNNHYGESYRVELYGVVGFYCAFMLILAALLIVIIRPKP